MKFGFLTTGDGVGLVFFGPLILAASFGILLLSRRMIHSKIKDEKKQERAALVSTLLFALVNVIAFVLLLGS